MKAVPTQKRKRSKVVFDELQWSQDLDIIFAGLHDLHGLRPGGLALAVDSHAVLFRRVLLAHMHHSMLQMEEVHVNGTAHITSMASRLLLPAPPYRVRNGCLRPSKMTVREPLQPPTAMVGFLKSKMTVRKTLQPPTAMVSFLKSKMTVRKTLQPPTAMVSFLKSKMTVRKTLQPPTAMVSFLESKMTVREPLQPPTAMVSF
jgi:hypothetical protein